MTPDYALGVFIPRTMNRVTKRLTIAIWIGLLPVSLWAYVTRPPAASAHPEHGKRASTVEAGTLHEAHHE